MGRQIAIGATRNDLLPVLEQIYELGYTFWGFNQCAPLADMESIKAYFLKKNGGLYLTLPQSEVKYMKNGWVAVHSSDVIVDLAFNNYLQELSATSHGMK